MGEQKVSFSTNQKQLQHFVQHLLDDVHALQYMLDNNWFEDDIVRIGAEQEMCLIDAKTCKPACINMEVLENMPSYEWLTTELARFNLETNLTPQEFSGKCLSIMEEENRSGLRTIQQALGAHGARIILTGILPTLRKFDVEMHNLTPKPRYKALMEAINSQLTRENYELRLDGIDELMVKHNSPLIEACNTSFQVHLQVAPKDFVPMYNLAQTLAAPILAMAANSPILFTRRLWHETRIALFQQALDTRSTQEHMRERSPRVSFGKGWLQESILEIYREDIARFRVLLSDQIEEDSLVSIRDGKVPKLRALQVHNSTVYRWNRPCYGISPNGKPHLRIENRVLPAGPTVADEMANAAFWLGAMIGFQNKGIDITTQISWEDVRDNFEKAAKFGIDSKFTWFDDKKVSVCDLVLQDLLPIAEEGLKSRNIDPDDIEKYLGIIRARAEKHMNGARWQLRAFTKLKKEVSRDEAVTIMTSSILQNQEKGIPVHEWPLPNTSDLEDYRPSKLKVEEFMETDLFTAQKDDPIELVVEMMDWRKIRYMPVEDSKGQLGGLITSRILLRYFANRHHRLNGKKVVTAKDLMIDKPVTIDPEASIMDAMHTMRENKIGCLPVVKNGELMGIITEMDFLRISGRLMERLEK